MSSIFSSQSILTNSVDTIVAGALTIGGTATSIALTDNVTASGTLGVTGLTTATGGIRTLDIDTIGTNILNENSRMAIGTTRATELTIVKTSYSTIINSGDAFPLRVSNIEAVGGTDELKIGRDSTGLVSLGSANNSVSIADAIYIYTDTGTDTMYIDTNSSPAPFLIGTSTATAITIGSSGIPITLAGQVSISASGTIATPNATTRVAQAFGTTFTSTLPPKVYLTYDAGATSTNIITVCLAGFVGVAGAWTGFYYLTSTSSAGVADSKLNWVAIS